MAAGGMTNRAIAQSLFLTTRTIEMHLANAYHKLGVSARTELPSALGIAEEHSVDDSDLARANSSSPRTTGRPHNRSTALCVASLGRATASPQKTAAPSPMGRSSAPVPCAD